MTLLLAIDTAAACAVGVLAGEKLVCRESDSARHAAQEVLALIDETLNDAKLNLSQLEAIAVVTGPGSFTGLRIGIGAAQGLSSALQIPVVPISSLALQAWSASRHHPYKHWLVAQSARDDEIYFGAYQITESGYQAVGREQVGHPSSLDYTHLNPADRSTTIDWAAVGDAWHPSRPLLESLHSAPQFIENEHPANIEELCQLSLLLAQSGKHSTELILPNYVKEHMDYN